MMTFRQSGRATGVALLAALMLGGCAATPVPVPAPAAAVAPPAQGASPAARAWHFAGSDLAVDPDVTFGVLPNGMRYALRRNTTPQSSVVMRLRFDIGSLAEDEDQRGLAHFLEHMAFNGSRNVPEGEMIKLLERRGLAFGPDTNAATGFDSTTYMLDLPNAGDDMVATGLMLMRETAGNLTIDPAAVDRERGVILAERRARETFQMTNARDQLAFLYPGTRIPDRLPIGDADVIRTAPASRIRDFYERWYRPERATLVIVGDFDVAAMEGRVAAAFADWQGVGPAPADPDIGRIDFARPASADIFVHPAVADSVAIVWTRPYVDEADTRARREQQTLEAIGAAIVNRRLARIQLQPDAPFTSASVGAGSSWDIAETMSAAAEVKPGEWARGIGALEQEMRRARDHGFTAAEVAERVANIRTALRTAADNAATRRSAALAGSLLAAAEEETVVTTPADRLALFEAMADRITPETVLNALRTATNGFGASLIRATAKQPVAGGEAALLAALDQSRRLAVTPPAPADVARFGYTDFGTPGAVVADDRIADLGIRRVRFANNVMLNLKRTDFQQGLVSINLRIDGGNLLATRDDPTRVSLASLLPIGGLGRHSFDELRSILAGRSVAADFDAGTDHFGAVVTTTPADLELQAQVLAALVTDPGYRPEAIDLYRRILPRRYAQNDATPAAVIGRDVPGILRDGDPRFVTPPLDRMMALDWSGTRAALVDPLAKGAIEIGVVGDFDEARVIAAIAATFGALPPRRALFDPRRDARQLSFATDRSTRTLVHQGAADQAIVQTWWQARDDADQRDAVGLALLSAVMKLKLTEELRERLGKTYSPSVTADLSSHYRGFGHVMTSSDVDFADIAATEAAVDAVAAALATAPVDADTLDRARRPMLETATKARRENGYWLGYVARAASEPDRLDRSRNGIAVLGALTAADLQALARTYLIPSRAIRIRAISDKAAK